MTTLPEPKADPLHRPHFSLRRIASGTGAASVTALLALGVGVPITAAVVLGAVIGGGVIAWMTLAGHQRNLV
jgi:hypothetical protein